VPHEVPRSVSIHPNFATSLAPDHCCFACRAGAGANVAAVNRSTVPSLSVRHDVLGYAGREFRLMPLPSLLFRVIVLGAGWVRNCVCPFQSTSLV
jgi:hypothetical protein